MPAIHSLLLLTLLSIVLGTSTSRAADSERQSLWLSSPTEDCTKGAVILVHGLNLKPGAMDPLGKKLVDSGLAVYRLALPGHRGEDRKQRLTVQAKDLMESLTEAASLVRTKCPGPLYAVGFSLGGLLTVVAQGEGKVDFQKMVLIAPAISLRSYTHLVTWLFPFFDIIPSRGPVPYRASEDGTSEALYRALFVLYERSSQLDVKRLRRLTRIYLNPDDELISSTGISKYIVDHGLEVKWDLKTLDNDKAELNDFDHLGIDSKTLSPTSWHMLYRETQEFFSSSR